MRVAGLAERGSILQCALRDMGVPEHWLPLGCSWPSDHIAEHSWPRVALAPVHRSAAAPPLNLVIYTFPVCV